MLAVFGEGEEGNEVWLGIKISSRINGKVRLQYMEAIPDKPGMFLLTGTTDLYRKELVRHTFSQVSFITMPNYAQITRGRGRKKKKVGSRTTTKSPLDARILKQLAADSLQYTH